MSAYRVTLEQWRTLLALVDAGTYAAAAEALLKSQSSVTYAIQKLEQALGVAVFRIEGRRAVLTAAGELLVERARVLLEDATRLERAATSASAGWEARIGISVEVLFPTWLVLECLDELGRKSPHTRIELFESVMQGAQEDLLTGRADLAITPHPPTGFLGERLLDLSFVPVASPDHALLALGRALTLRDLRQHRHVLVRETGSRRDSTSGIRSEQSWTVSNMATSIGAVSRGFGFAWYPEHKVRNELAEGTLVRLPLARGGERSVTIYLVLADSEQPGPGVAELAAILRRRAGDATSL